MAYTFSNRTGFFLGPVATLPYTTINNSATTANDAAGESTTVIGKIILQGGAAGGSKTISSAGGKVYFVMNSVTFATATSSIRIGIQDINTTTGLEDGTFDVYADYVVGTETLASGVNRIPMEVGSKTIAHNDLIGVSLEFLVRAGADTFSLRKESSAFGNQFPYYTQDTGAGPAKVSGVDAPMIAIEFDDGTLGWFQGSIVAQYGSTTSFSNVSSPDEYALVFTCPFDMTVSSFFMMIGSIANTDDCEFVLYQNALTSPSVMETVAFDPDVSSPGNSKIYYTFANPQSLVTGGVYALALKAGAGTISVQTMTLGTGNSILRTSTMLGTNWALGTRTDATGAFSLTTTSFPVFGLFVDTIPTGGGGNNTFG